MTKYLSEKEFLESFKNVPRVAITFFIRNNSGGFLLTKRSNFPQAGKWHLPGGFILKDESIANSFRRILKKEIGIDKFPSPVLMGVFENLTSDERGHIIDIIYSFKTKDLEIKTTLESQEVSFFSTPPLNTGFNHSSIIKTLLKKES